MVRYPRRGKGIRCEPVLSVLEEVDHACFGGTIDLLIPEVHCSLSPVLVMTRV